MSVGTQILTGCLCFSCISHNFKIYLVEKCLISQPLPKPGEACNLAGIKMLAVIGAGLQALQSCHVPRDDGTQWRLLLVSEQPCNRCLFNALWFNFLLFRAVRGGLVNLSYFFIMFVHSSVPVNILHRGMAERGQRTGFTALPPSTCGPLKLELVNGRAQSSSENPPTILQWERRFEPEMSLFLECA